MKYIANSRCHLVQPAPAPAPTRSRAPRCSVLRLCAAGPPYLSLKVIYKAARLTYSTYLYTVKYTHFIHYTILTYLLYLLAVIWDTFVRA